ncbi:MAG: DUF4340 domain-containing protein [Bacteroidia bacterium]
MKNRSSLVIISILVALSGISFYLYKTKNKTSTLDQDSRNFKLEDTASITRIFLADKNGKSITLTKNDNKWLVNGKYPARQEAISILLYTIKMLDVKSPVARSAKANVIKFMAAKSVKIEIYYGSELVKQYYVGHEGPNSDGTYMILTDLDSGKNYEDPYLVYIPGFNGFLSVRYFVNEAEWRDRLVINYTPPQISSITMEHLNNPDSSFVIKLNSTTSFELHKLNNGASLPFDETRMKQYLAYFQNISYETLLTGNKGRTIDSLKQVLPYMRLSIVTKNEGTKTFSFIKKNSTYELNKKYGIDYKYDPDRLFMRFDNEKEIAVIQYYVFGKLLQNYDYFSPKNTVKK